MADDSENDPPEVIFAHPPSDEEERDWFLELAGDDPKRRAAVERWLDGSWPRGGPGLIVNYVDDRLEMIRCEDIHLRPEHLESLILFPEITSLELLRTPLPKEMLDILALQKHLEFLSSIGDPNLDNRICEVAAQLPNLKGLTLDSPRIDDQGIKLLSRHPSLMGLSLVGSSLTPTAARHFSEIQNLENLQISNCPFDNEAMLHISKISKLVCLQLLDCSFDDEAMPHLAKLTELQWLLLANAKITDAGVAHLKTLTNLHTLNLNGTLVSDHSVRAIAQMSGLGRVHLDGTKITNDSTRLLSKILKLYDLSLRNTAIDDRCVPDLIKMPFLSTLDIRGTKISRTGAKRIRTESKKDVSMQSDYGHFLRNPDHAQETFDRETALASYETALPEDWFDSSLIDNLNGVWVHPSETGTGYHTRITVIKDMKYMGYRYNATEMDPIDDFVIRGPVIGQSGVYFFPNRASLYGANFLIEESGHKLLLSKQGYEDYVRTGKLNIYLLIRVADSMDFKSPPKRPSLRVLGLPFESP